MYTKRRGVTIILNINQKVIEDVLLDLETLKSNLLNNYQREQVIEHTARNDGYQKPLIINGYPVYQFSYAGSLPLNKTSDDKLKNLIKSYTEWCTHNIYSPKDKVLPFKKAKIFIQHFYNNNVITDLDNRNHKYIIDAIRMAQIIEDDSWQNVSLDISGYIDDKSHVQVFVVDDKHKHDFAQYLDIHRYELIKKPFPHEMFMKETDESEQEEFLKEDHFFWD